MKWRYSSRGLFILGFAVLAVSNIAVLSGVAYNRSGDPKTRITLTERELPLRYDVFEENSGMALRLAWRVLPAEEDERPYPGWGFPAWLTAEKLRALGFALDKDPGSDENRNRTQEPIPKEVFIVLEQEGAPYRETVARAERALAREEGPYRANGGDKRLRENFEAAQKRLQRECTTESRLFAVDAGRDPAGLRRTYADRERFIIAKGLVKPAYHYEDKVKRVRGTILRLSVEGIHVPLAHRGVFDAVLAEEKPRDASFIPPRYRVELAFGRRFEPWIVSAAVSPPP